MIISDKNGNVLENIYPVQCLSNKFAQLTFSVVVATYNNKSVLIYNKWREQWELPGGYIDQGESAKDAAIREMYEETGHQIETAELQGTIKYFSVKKNRYEYGAIYNNQLKKSFSFTTNDEAEAMILWDSTVTINGYISEVDQEIIKFVIDET